MTPAGPSRRLSTQDSAFVYFEKDTAPISANAPAQTASPYPARPNDARKAFEDLFKK